MAFDLPRQKSVSQSHFAMVPRGDVPRSLFKNRSAHKTTFDAGYLVPVYLNEVLPGDSFRMKMTAFTRMQPAVFPIMDNLYMDSFWFFVPCRLVWTNWNKFMGERTPLPTSSTDYLIPRMEILEFTGSEPGQLADYFGFPNQSQMTDPLSAINALPFRAYQYIYDQWFRDQNIQDSPVASELFFGDGPDAWDVVNVIRRRGKRHDYFTSCLPWPQKGDAAAVPLSGLAPVQGLGIQQAGMTPVLNLPVHETARGAPTYPFGYRSNVDDVFIQIDANSATANPLIYADLSQATGALINDLRLADAM